MRPTKPDNSDLNKPKLDTLLIDHTLAYQQGFLPIVKKLIKSWVTMKNVSPIATSFKIPSFYLVKIRDFNK